MRPRSARAPRGRRPRSPRPAAPRASGAPAPGRRRPCPPPTRRSDAPPRRSARPPSRSRPRRPRRRPARGRTGDLVEHRAQIAVVQRHQDMSITDRARAGKPGRHRSARPWARSPPLRAPLPGLRPAGRGTPRRRVPARRSRRDRTARRQLLRGLYPPGRSRRQQAQSSPRRSSSYPDEALTKLQTCRRTVSSSSFSRSLPRQREIRLAIVPAGRSSASRSCGSSRRGRRSGRGSRGSPRERLEPLLDVERLVELLEHRVGLLRLQLLGGMLARRGTEPVDAGIPRQLREPRPDRVVVAKRAEPLVGLARTSWNTSSASCSGRR